MRTPFIARRIRALANQQRALPTSLLDGFFKGESAQRVLAEMLDVLA